jgi:PadR family transcriptional regulator PadR
MLGEFEYLIISAASRLGEDAYGAAIRKEIEDATGDRCSIGALYTTLDRLEAKGFIKTRMGDPTPQRGGRAKRMVRVTANGVHAASDFYAAVTRVSRGVSWKANRVSHRYLATRRPSRPHRYDKAGAPQIAIFREPAPCKGDRDSQRHPLHIPLPRGGSDLTDQRLRE